MSDIWQNNGAIHWNFKLPAGPDAAELSVLSPLLELLPPSLPPHDLVARVESRIDEANC